MSDRTTSSSNPRHGVILGVVCLALAAVVAAMSSLNVGLPDIARDTHARRSDSGRSRSAAKSCLRDPGEQDSCH